jgi:hypothetical protein
MIIKADSVEILHADRGVELDLLNPDFSNLKRKDVEEIINDFNDNQTVLDIIGKEAAMEYWNLKE